MNAFVRPARHVFLPIDAIDLSHAIRPYNASVVAELAQSIRAIGLQTPLTCVIRDARHILVAGRNRLEALRTIGAEQAPSVSSTSATLRPSSGSSARICIGPN
jgi:ParB-like chromosome segregation protein Spo0J